MDLAMASVKVRAFFSISTAWAETACYGGHQVRAYIHTYKHERQKALEGHCHPCRCAFYSVFVVYDTTYLQALYCIVAGPLSQDANHHSTPADLFHLY